MANTNHPGADTNAALRRQLVDLLQKSEAHQSFEAAVKELPAALRGVKPDKLPYSIWQLVDHIRIAQWDILEFSRDPTHQSPPWPEGYWNTAVQPPDDAAWQQVLDQIKADRDAFVALLNEPEQNLFKPLAHGQGQTLLREALLIADHTAYHVGEIILIRRLLNAWQG
ncbi:DinB family protein [Fibrella forsythiae]|uniref:DinB family protein n=1 Tax=Fibrella forsythiae TaxID=2817061 RepID=A0ABS3JS34_9BACT|nr:DinB family protein [Fibrella forsythiae]MBO0952820.1 DinB family protein [Fibrella forsythiae]